MNPASSTKLRLLAETCPHALDYYEAGVQGDTAIFGPGTAAHAVLDAVHKRINAGGGMREEIARKIAASVMATLALDGRTHNGQKQPPIPLDDAKRGAEMALRYLSMTDYQLPQGAHPEIGLAVDRDWRPVPYNAPNVFYRGILDLCGTYEDEDGQIVVYTRDYKTAWSTGPDAPDTLQLRGQILLLLAHAEHVLKVEQIDVAVREVVSVQSGAVFSAGDDLNNYGGEQHDLWREEISATVRHMERMERPRPAMPGPACGRCQYRRVCDAADPAAKNEPDTARRFATFRAHGDQLEKVLRELTSDEPLEVDGRLLGWEPATRNEPHREAGARLWELVTGRPAVGAERTLLRLLTTVSGIKDAAALVHRGPDQREAREALIGELTVKKPSARWGFFAPPEPVEAAAERPELVLVAPEPLPEPDYPEPPGPEKPTAYEPLEITPGLSDLLF